MLPLFIAVTLNQHGRSVPFFSWTLNNIKIKHHALEKEGAAIVEDLQQCGNYSAIKVITDQKSIRYMYDNNQKSKIKNH